MAANTNPMPEFDEKVQASDKEYLVKDLRYYKGKDTQCFGRKCNYILEPLMLIFMLANYPTFYTIPEYVRMREVEKLTGSTNFTKSHSKCHGEAENGTSSTAGSGNDPMKGNMTLASSAASYFDLEMMLVQSIPAIFTAMFLGSFSDKAGRKYGLLPPLIGQVLVALFCTVTAIFNAPLELILVGAFLHGLSGQVYTFYSACNAYVSDVSEEKDRSLRLVIITILLMISAMVSTAIQGYLVQYIGFTWVFVAILVISVAIVMYVVLLVPETVERDPEVKFFTLVHMKNFFKTVFTDDSTKRRWKILVLYTALFSERLISGGSSIDTFYTMGPPLCWDTALVGLYGSTKHGFAVVGFGLLMFTLRHRVKDQYWCITGGISLITGQVVKFFAVTTFIMFASGALEFAGGFFGTCAISMISKLVSINEVGAIFAGDAVLKLCSGLLGHVMYNPFYSAMSQAGHPRAVYLVMAACLVISTLIMCIYTILIRKEARMTKSDDKEGNYVNKEGK